jgi:OmpA-OmpF porin, OOP family
LPEKNTEPPTKRLTQQKRGEDMNMHMKALAVLVALVFCAGCAAQKAAGPGCKSMVNVQKYKQKAESFLILFDSSETMAGKIGEKQKLDIAKDTVRCMNQCMQSVKVNGGLRTFGHGYYLFSIFQTDLIYGIELYSPDKLRQALCKIDVATGNSPMVKALNEAEWDLKAVQGQKTALIIISDGKPTDGDAVAAAEKMKKAMGDNLCIYTVQVGDDYDGKVLLEKIVKAGGCGFATNADKLAGCEPMTDFVERVLFDKCVHDADGDGVCDEADACPKTPKGAKVDAHGCWSMILFDYNKASIKKSAQPALDEVANVLTAVDNADVKIIIKGYADSTGSERYNEALSNKRAQAVREYLMNRGIKSSRLATKALGSSNPVAENTTAAGRASNRRVEFATEQ